MGAEDKAGRCVKTRAAEGAGMWECSIRSIEKNGGKWRVEVQYREVSDDIDPATGERTCGEWRRKKHNLGVACNQKDNTGQRQAKLEADQWLQAFKESLRIDAERKAEAEKEPTEPEPEPAHVLTVGEYVERYIESVAPSVTPTTTSSHKKVYHNQLQPYSIAAVPLEGLTAEHVDAWLGELSKGTESTRAYSDIVCKKAYHLLKAALKQAVDRDILLKSPMRGTRAPKAEPHRPNALDERAAGRVVQLLDMAPFARANVAIRLMLYTGMREGEVCGLRWRNVDLEAGTLRVCESIGRADKADIRGEQSAGYVGQYLKGPKNRGSVRVVPLAPSLVQVLRGRKLEAIAEREQLGGRFSGDMFVCGDAEGKPLHWQKLTRTWNAVVQVLDLVGTEGGVPTVYDLRHTYATLAFASGIDPKTVQNGLGHSSLAMTMNTYASVNPDASRRAADAMGEMYDRAAKDAAGRGRVVEFRPELRRTGTGE